MHTYLRKEMLAKKPLLILHNSMKICLENYLKYPRVFNFSNKKYIKHTLGVYWQLILICLSAHMKIRAPSKVLL